MNIQQDSCKLSEPAYINLSICPRYFADINIKSRTYMQTENMLSLKVKHKAVYTLKKLGN